MSNNTVPNILPPDDEQLQLQISIEAVTQERDTIHHQIQAFEDVLQLHLTDYIIEAQELNTLYKQQKRAKKDNRLAQKQRGKNYKAPKGLQPQNQKLSSDSTPDLETLQLKKRLYREAMLHVHPDKFSLSPNEQESATEITTQLIHIYKHENLEALQTLHAQIFSDSLDINLNIKSKDIPTIGKTEALQLTLKQLEKELEVLKASELYAIISTYKNPLHFIDELIIYYKDKIEKLKKRTRTKKN
ncbi:hypothetical protein BN863_7070 [Formosa agariphila KMM 3901]|uniref:J domain-containing protein n=1 Tax=Formosa agariphila (strain DSM 15362 / KCTC 12365 / LMG 23005 / KMM 3901 / M-2Alg 35-1) TaxID=1347342 RepID=T2KK83_FORAG|nr:hypothetical protein [Formosa agariphila]CDF78419.1 hypothetical protein BN863_7070 [Formosa agariphila KMM 3901]